MSNDRSKTPFSCCYFIPSSFYQNSPTQQTPYYRQPSVAAAGSPSVLFSGFFSRFSSSSSSSSLQINYFVREDEGGKTETKQGGAPCSTSGVVLYNLTFEFLNTSFFWSFFFICINIYSLVFNRYPFAFLRLFYILEKDFVNYCFLCLSKWGSHQEKNIKTNPPPSTSPFISIPALLEEMGSQHSSSYRSPLLFHSSFFNSKWFQLQPRKEKLNY